jgi:GMP synthase (glutamine-hydrolysing)
MPKSVLIIQNDEIDTPGTLLHVLKSRGVDICLIKAYESNLPSELDGLSGLIVLGGHMGVYETEKYPFLLEEMALIRSAISDNKPVLGICLGAQLLAGALGASVHPHTLTEIGWMPISLTPKGLSDPLFTGLGETITLLDWHGDTFELPEGADLLATSELCQQQAIRFGKNAYGIQFHLEAELTNITTLVETSPDSMAAAHTDGPTILSETSKHFPNMLKLAHIIFGRWIDLLD